MQLDKIKLAGFKSFVDPTEVALPSKLVAILGPNGCGKSNIIDAVRWVMGESSAKHLRGASMADVIFSGCETRKPLGQASVELTFKECDGKITGEYSQYSEIALKRTVTRDGQSQYFLNGTRCRRKDITEIFLGTGLGPRNYSIIGQGEISRIIDAKPDDLRVFFDEASGNSKYKERRRETENRIRHTRENLERLTDIRDELGKQLDRLQRQAKAAERYQVLKGQEHLLKAQLLALNWQSIAAQLKEQDELIAQQQIELEAIISKQRSIDTDIEKKRELYAEKNEHFNKIQETYYQLGAEIARLEETIQHNRERREQFESDLQEAQHELKNHESQLNKDNEQYGLLKNLLQNLEPELDVMKEVETTLLDALQAEESQQKEWQKSWDEFNTNAAESSKQAHVEQTKIQHLERSLTQIQQRLEKLMQEKCQINTDEVQQVLTQCKQDELEFNNEHESAHQNLTTALNEIQEQRQKIDVCRTELNKEQSDLQSLRGRFASLEALQQAALGEQDDEVQAWLTQNQLTSNKRLAQQLDVESGWELAVETVLGDYLQAVCVTDLQSLTEALEEFSSGSMTLVDTMTYLFDDRSSEMSFPLLSNKVTTNISLVHHLFEHVAVAADLADAYSMLEHLPQNGSVITKEGIWLGKGWLRVAKDKDATAGILQREQLLKQLQHDIEAKEKRVTELESDYETKQNELQDCEELRDLRQTALNEVNAKLTDLKAQMRIKQAHLDQFEHRINEISTEIESEQKRSEENQQELEQTRECWQTAMHAMEQDSNLRETLIASRDEVNQRLDQARQQLNAHRNTMHQSQLKIQSHQSEVKTIEQNNERITQRIEQLRAKTNSLNDALAKVQQPNEDLGAQLEEKLEKHLKFEQNLQDIRKEVEEVDSQIQALEQSRHQEEESERAKQQKLEQARMNRQGDVVRRSTIEEQLSESEFQLEQLIAEMPEVANQTAWADEIERVTNRIQRLGAINLAAIDEYKTESERKNYLDAQNDDLIEALDVLENAIRKIDKEARERFKSTYDKINTEFQRLFPKLFGGGKAYLELTGDDLLDTGVTMIARPPGKQNTSIAMLSGGEKALTAVALVFAIFHLNPSPFCMLDEVDAPLDDANVARFCSLVKEMSKAVQFIFITHNKLTMELADYLSGVTMHEPGVSRIVSVDVDEAVSLAEG